MERKITIEEHVLYKEDYQMKMLKANSLEGFLRVGGRGINGSSYYDYDVSGKLSLKAMYARARFRAEDIRLLLTQFGNAVRETEKYLLDKNCILLEPDYIFFEDGNFYFCYYPPSKQDIWEGFHQLTEYLVKVADYQDQECVRLVFLLHKETMEENYSLEKLIEICQEKQPEEKSKNQNNNQKLDITSDVQESFFEDKKEEASEIRYDTREHDWISEQKMGSAILRETDNLWSPVKRFLNKHKKAKWGEWDGLHIEKEEL